MGNFTQPTNISGIPDMFQYAHSVSDDIFGPLILVVLYIVAYLVLRNRKQSEIDSAIAAGFVTSVSATILLFFNIISGFHQFVAIAVFAAALLWKAYST